MEAVHYQSIRKFGKIRVFDAEFGFADCHASYESRFVKKDGCSSGQAAVIAPSGCFSFFPAILLPFGELFVPLHPNYNY